MLFKKIITVISFTLLILVTATTVKAQNSTKIYFFYGTGCSHCAEVLNYFEKNDLFNRYPIEKKEIYFDRNNSLLFNAIMEKLEIPSNLRGVPAVIIGNIAIIGDGPIINNFITEADKYLKEKANDLQVQNQAKSEKKEEGLDLTLAAVIGASLVDAINPCAFAVLIILMSTILANSDGKKALKAGIAFAISVFISYFLMGLGLYKALGVGEMSYIFYKIVGWLAIILGLANLKDYFWYGKVFIMEVPLSWRPKLKNIIKSVTSPQGAFVTGFLVSLFLLPCTSGPYIVILAMLAKKTLFIKAIFYLILYNLIFVTPMVLISLAVYKGFDPAKAEKIRQKRLKTLHLIAAIMMLTMGIIILGGWI